jgi:hypothetical protein
MKQFFPSHSMRLPESGYRPALIALLAAVILGLGVFSLTPAAHAASTTHAIPARANNCVSGAPCVTVWATNVNVRDWRPGNCLSFPSTNCPVVDHLAGGHETVEAVCQQPGQTITADGITNNWWMDIFGDNGQLGWASNIFIVGGQKIAGVPDCGF